MPYCDECATESEEECPYHDLHDCAECGGEAAEPELWTTKQAADYCGINRYLVHQYRSRNGFPEPVPDRRSGDGQRLFDADLVRAWQASRRGAGRRRATT